MLVAAAALWVYAPVRAQSDLTNEVALLRGIKRIYYSRTPHQESLLRDLRQLDVDLVNVLGQTESLRPVDATVFLRVNPVDAEKSSVQLLLTQQCQLVRLPGHRCYPVTYSAEQVVKSDRIDEAVKSLTAQFAIDFLKANK